MVGVRAAALVATIVIPKVVLTVVNFGMYLSTKVVGS
tara:strand:+ start:854 stop:964 length:111 start_codon:yes stop_codon:yes gene_type:complete